MSSQTLTYLGRVFLRISRNLLSDLIVCVCFLLKVTTRGEAHLELNAFRRKHDCALVISGDSLEVRTWFLLN